MPYRKGDPVTLLMPYPNGSFHYAEDCRVVLDLGKSVVIMAEEAYQKAMEQEGATLVGHAYPRHFIQPRSTAAFQAQHFLRQGSMLDQN